MLDEPIHSALLAGTRRSREACSLRVAEPLRLVVWRRYKWTIVGIGFFLFLDLVVGIAASNVGVRF